MKVLCETTKKPRVSTSKWGIVLPRGALMAIGHIKSGSRDWPSTAVWYEQAVSCFREAGDRAGLSDALHCLGSVLFLADQPERSRKVLLGEAVDVAQAEGNEHLVAEAKRLLDHLAEDTGIRPEVARS